VDSLAPAIKMVVLQFARTAEVKQTRNEREIRAAPRNPVVRAWIRRHDCVGAENCGVARARRGKESNPEIHLFSDGAVAGHG